MTRNFDRDVANSQISRCLAGDDYGGIMSHPEFWAALSHSEQDVEILQRVAGQHRDVGLPLAGVFDAGLVRVEKEHGGCYMRHPQWMQVHMATIRKEGSRLAGQIRRDRIDLRSFDIANLPIRCPRVSTIHDACEGLMGIPEFWAALSKQDHKILQHVAGQHERFGLPSADVFAAGLVRVGNEHGECYIRHPQWMQVHVATIRKEGSRLAGQIRRDRINLRSFDITTRAGDSVKLDFPSPSATPLDRRLEDQGEALVKHVIQTMREVVDNFVATRQIPPHRADGCKTVFEAFLDDPTESLSAYGKALAPHISRPRLHAYWAITRTESIKRLGGGGEFLAQLGRPKGPRPAKPAGTLRRLPRKASRKPKR